MMTYVTAFIFYTFAMIGILLIAFVIYKKTFMNIKSDAKGIIKIIDSQPIGNKKMLMVVKVKDEKFLIATGPESTTFLSKLNFENNQKRTQKTTKKEEINDNFQQENMFLNSQENKINQIQKQFMDLYSKEETIPAKEEEIDPIPHRREMIRKLLKDLNNVNAKKEARF